MRTIVLFFMLLISLLNPIFAATPQCTPVSFKLDGNNIILPGSNDPKKSLVYFFQNKSLQSLWIDHPDLKKRGVSAGWTSYVRPGNWSALVLNRKNFSVSCSMIQPGKVEPLDCAKALFVCAPQNLTSTIPLDSNFWLAEDKKWEEFLHAIKKRGVDFH